MVNADTQSIASAIPGGLTSPSDRSREVAPATSPASVSVLAGTRRRTISAVRAASG